MPRAVEVAFTILVLGSIMISYTVVTGNAAVSSKFSSGSSVSALTTRTVTSSYVKCEDIAGKCVRSSQPCPSGYELNTYAKCRLKSQKCCILGAVTSNMISPCDPYGDVDADGYLSVADALIVQKYVARQITLTQDQLMRADVTGEGYVNSVDGMRILRYVAGLDIDFAVCSRATTTTTIPDCGTVGGICVNPAEGCPGGYEPSSYAECSKGLCCVLGGVSQPPSPPPCGNYGDVNGDGSVTSIDALFIQRYVAGLNPSPFNESSANVDGRGGVTSIDALFVLKYVAGKITTFDVCETTLPIRTTTLPRTSVNSNTGWHGSSCTQSSQCDPGLCCIQGAADPKYNNECHLKTSTHGGTCMA